MKRLLLLVFLVLFFSVATAVAMPMPEANNNVTIDYGTYHIGNGGEFKISGTNSAGTEYWYTTFCLERNEFFNPGYTYKVDSVEDYAASGGISGYVDGKDYVSDATKWIMNEYINNYEELFNDFGVADKNIFAGFVQDSIWYLEGEISEGNALTSYILAELGGNSYTEGYMDWVKVVNLVDASGNPLQSQLFAAAPVPEPATLMLLGTGLIGLAGVSRKKFKK